MNDFIETFTVPLENDFGSWLLLILMWVLLLGFVFLIGWGLYSLIDYCYLPVHTGYGVIHEKIYEPAYTSTVMVYNAATKTSMPTTVYHSESWHLNIIIDDKIGSIYMGADEYVSYKHGSKVMCEYSIGRLSGDLYVKSVK